MPVNLINEKDLDAYLLKMIYRQSEAEVLKENQFENSSVLQKQKDKVVRAMLWQWSKRYMSPFLSTKTVETKDFLQTVQKTDNLPDWAKNCIDKGQEIYRFQSDKISAQTAEKLNMVRDFLFVKAEGYVNTILAKAKDTERKCAKNPGNPKNNRKIVLRLDFLKTQEEYTDFNRVLQAAEEWHDVIADKMAKKAHDEKLRREAAAGTRTVMELADGMRIVQLTTSEALDYESEYMGHCVGQGCYDEVVKNGTTQIYSLRDADDEPHATLEISDKAVQQCKGKENKAPIAKYKPYIQQFVKKKKFNIAHDCVNIGLLKQKGKYYDIMNLPKDKAFCINGDLDLSKQKLSQIPDFSSVTINGSFYVDGNMLTDFKNFPKEVKRHVNISGNPIQSFKGWHTKVGGELHAFNVPAEFDAAALPKKLVESAFVWSPQTDSFVVPLGKQYIDLRKQERGFTYNGDLDLSNSGCDKLPDLSHIGVQGCFCCAGNPLKDLVGSPMFVGEEYDAGDTQITSLEGISPSVGESINLVSNHHLTSLKGISGANCYNINLMDCEKLMDFDELPQTMDGCFYIEDKLAEKYNLPNSPTLVQVKAAVSRMKVAQHIAEGAENGKSAEPAQKQGKQRAPKVYE